MAFGITMKAAKVEISTDGTNWSDISGKFNTITPGGGARETGETHTGGQAKPVMGVGGLAAVELTVKILYTEGLSDAYKKVLDAYKAGTALYLRYSPLGGSQGQFMYTTDEGIVTTAPYPGGDVGSGEPIPVEFTLKTAALNDSVIS